MMDSVTVSALGDWVKARREILGLTQRDLAGSVGTAPAYLSQIESGRVALPNADLRRRIAVALGVPIKLISERLGHSSIVFTIAVYVHTDEGQHRELAATMGNLLSAES